MNIFEPRWTWEKKKQKITLWFLEILLENMGGKILGTIILLNLDRCPLLQRLCGIMTYMMEVIYLMWLLLSHEEPSGDGVIKKEKPYNNLSESRWSNPSKNGIREWELKSQPDFSNIDIEQSTEKTLWNYQYMHISMVLVANKPRTWYEPWWKKFHVARHKKEETPKHRHIFINWYVLYEHQTFWWIQIMQKRHNS